jgi:benzodiazapine receptor
MNSLDTRTQKPLVSFLIVFAIFQLVGGFLGWVSGPGMDGWYDSLVKSPLNPPGIVFGIVWPVLYGLLAYSFWTVWRKENLLDRNFVLRLFAAHMVLNWAWSPVFFIAHNIIAALVLLFILIFTASMLLWLIWPIDKKAAIVLVPYLGWLTFAGHLTHYILKNSS